MVTFWAGKHLARVSFLNGYNYNSVATLIATNVCVDTVQQNLEKKKFSYTILYVRPLLYIGKRTSVIYV